MLCNAIVYDIGKLFSYDAKIEYFDFLLRSLSHTFSQVGILNQLANAVGLL